MCVGRSSGRVGRWRRPLGPAGLLLVVLLVLTGCASLPESSAPQALRTIDREPAAEGPTPPIAGRDPDLLLRDFLTATADPTSRHLAARQYMTPSASAQWDDTAGTTIVERPDTLLESRDGTRATYRIRAQRVAELSADGVYRAVTEPTLENQIEMVRVDGEWRIASLPPGVVMDSSAFAKSYRRYVLYFADPTGTSAVPDLRWLSVPKNQLAQRLLGLLLEGPRENLGPVVGNRLAPPVTLRGPITKANGDPQDVGVGLGGVRVDFAGAGALDQRDKEMLAGQVVLTLSEADIPGPYVLLADGEPLDQRFATNGWTVADVDYLNPTVRGINRIGLHALRGGTLAQVTEGGVVDVPGYFGSVNNLRSAALSPDGQLVAAVADAGRPASEPQRTLMVGTYGGNAIPVAEGETISRPSWNGDGSAAWAVINGMQVIRAVRDNATNTVSRQDVDISALTDNDTGLTLRMPITELRVSRTGVRAALIADGKVYVALIVRGPNGNYSLTKPVPVAVGLSSSAVSLSWVDGDLLLIAREGNIDPVSTVHIDGSEWRPLTSPNLTPPVRVVAAVPSAQYVADARGVLELSGNPGEQSYWTEMPGLVGNDATPVLPG
ncbi:MAG TPA: MtrAB system accessory lipoprotein LpqB [Nocardia sp.]|nr:MtrAB system accessory lipoprotein LpqB [Nocardia sp.]HLS76688.1 MtrAB system accessory lipoprotein LpqB [Nocardia sp.]